MIGLCKQVEPHLLEIVLVPIHAFTLTNETKFDTQHCTGEAVQKSFFIKVIVSKKSPLCGYFSWFVLFLKSAYTFFSRTEAPLVMSIIITMSNLYAIRSTDELCI